VHLLLLLLCIAGCAALGWTFHRAIRRAGRTTPERPRAAAGETGPTLDGLRPVGSDRLPWGCMCWLMGLFVIAYFGHYWAYHGITRRETVDEGLFAVAPVIVLILAFASSFLLTRSWWRRVILVAVTVWIYWIFGTVAVILTEIDSPGY
jgi:hypothetical protein